MQLKLNEKKKFLSNRDAAYNNLINADKKKPYREIIRDLITKIEIVHQSRTCTREREVQKDAHGFGPQTTNESEGNVLKAWVTEEVRCRVDSHLKKF